MPLSPTANCKAPTRSRVGRGVAGAVPGLPGLPAFPCTQEHSDARVLGAHAGDLADQLPSTGSEWQETTREAASQREGTCPRETLGSLGCGSRVSSRAPALKKTRKGRGSTAPLWTVCCRPRAAVPRLRDSLKMPVAPRFFRRGFKHVCHFLDDHP